MFLKLLYMAYYDLWTLIYRLSHVRARSSSKLITMDILLFMSKKKFEIE